MGAAVEGKLDADVPGEVLDALRVCPSREQDREAPMPLLTPL